LYKLHPALREWFTGRFANPTEIQKRALPNTLSGRNTLILAPTGSGKTLAAFLSVLSELASEAELPNAVRAVYVSPLRALDRDIHRNLQGPLDAVNAGRRENRRVRMEVRTGDTAIRERSRQVRRRPHLLLTTPESLSALLSQKAWRDGFAPRCVVVDEVHAFAESKRGSLLTLLLERLEACSLGELQRIGLSATAWPLEAVERFLCGDRSCETVMVDLRRAHRLQVAEPDPEYKLPPAGYNPYRAAFTVAELVKAARCSLVFTSTRSAAERLGLALKIVLPEMDDHIAVHHASIDMATRTRIEDGLAEGRYRAVVCSTSLELGVDFAAVDQVLLIGAPRGVSRALQRLGRSGHRMDGIAQGWLVPLSLPDLVECVALRQAAHSGRLDALRIPRAPLDVLAQMLLGMSIERPWTPDEAYGLLRRAGPYTSLTRPDFDAVLRYLAGVSRVLGEERYGKIRFADDGSFAVASAKIAREYYMNIGTISDDYQMKIVSRGNRRLGEVEESFIAALQPGEAFIIGGKPVVVKLTYRDTAVVEPARGENVKTPRWMGGKMSLSAQLAAEELRVRRSLRAAWDAGGFSACVRALEDEWGVTRYTAEVIASYVERQNNAAPVPVDSPVQVERIRRKRSVLLLFHSLAGRPVNRCLAWVTGHRLGGAGSVVANFDDYGFLLSLDKRSEPGADQLRAAFNPQQWREDLQTALESTETLGRRFRSVAETGHLLPRRTLHGATPRRAASWSGSILYKTLRQHQPDHPLLREALRQTMEDELDSNRAQTEAARIYRAPWEFYDLPRPSPFGLTLFAFFNRETLMAQDPERAIDELVESLYADWELPHEPAV
jgi:ATP-dependent Lhr-like helicase